MIFGVLAMCCIWAGSIRSVQAQLQRPLSREEIDSIVNPRTDGPCPLQFEREEVRLNPLSEDDAPVTVDFPFVNGGSDPVVITRVATTCGCTTAEYDRRPVPAGGSGHIRITFDPDGQPGNLLRKVFVYTNRSHTAPAMQLVLTGTVHPTSDKWRDYPYTVGALRLRQPAVVFRNVGRGVRAAESIVCANSGTLPLHPETGELPCFLQFTSRPETIAPEEEADLVFRFDGNALPADVPDTIRIPVNLCGVGTLQSKQVIQITVILK